MADVRPLTATEMAAFLDEWLGPGGDAVEVRRALAALLAEVEHALEWREGQPWAVVSGADSALLCPKCNGGDTGKPLCGYHGGRLVLGLDLPAEPSKG